jgi:hypothetical protein
MAGSTSAAKERVPNRPRRANHASTAPGTVTASGPWRGIAGAGERCRTASGVAAAGARPEPL